MEDLKEDIKEDETPEPIAIIDKTPKEKPENKTSKDTKDPYSSMDLTVEEIETYMEDLGIRII